MAGFLNTDKGKDYHDLQNDTEAKLMPYQKMPGYFWSKQEESTSNGQIFSHIKEFHSKDLLLQRIFNRGQTDLIMCVG